MKPKKYKNSKGEDRWQIQLYVGRDATGKQINWKRKGFTTRNEALIAIQSDLKTVTRFLLQITL